MKLREYFDKHPETSQKMLAEQIGSTQELISMIATEKRKPSIEKCILIEEATGGEVSVEELRPDISWDKMKNNLLRRMITA